MLMLSSALKGIRSCCEMLSEGKAEIQRIKKGISDAKEIAKEVSGFWSWIQGLFLPKDKQPSVVVKVEEPKKKVKDEYVDYIPDEDAVIDQFIKHVGDFFKAQAYLVAYKEDLERKVFSSSPDTVIVLCFWKDRGQFKIKSSTTSDRLVIIGALEEAKIKFQMDGYV